MKSTADLNQYHEQHGLAFEISHHLHVSWFEHWHPVLDEALQNLPEMSTCPHELFRLFFQDSDPAQKKLAVITERDEPVALAGLRKYGNHSWAPVTQWIAPGAVFPAKPGYLIPAIETLGIDIWVAWWRMGESAPQSHLMKYLDATPTYRLHLTEDFEHYWRENGYFKTIRRVRNRCRGFTSVINMPGAAEWTIKNWETKWHCNAEANDSSLSDRLLAARFLESRGKHFCVSLLDGDTVIGGATMIVHDKDVVAEVIYRDPKYSQCGVGDRLIDLSINFAAEQGFETFDLGGGQDYKRHWGRQEGTRWVFSICPELLFRAKQLANLVRKVRGTVSHWFN